MKSSSKKSSTKSSSSAPYEFLKSLLNTPSPSGFETHGQKVWVDYVRQFADSVEIDSYGNAFATLNPASGKGDPTVFLSGHVDELGLMVSHISDEGFLYFKGIGGVDKALIRGQRVTVHGSGGPIPGVTGLLAIHMQEPDDRNKVPEIHAMHIDIGVSSRNFRSLPGVASQLAAVTIESVPGRQRKPCDSSSSRRINSRPRSLPSPRFKRRTVSTVPRWQDIASIPMWRSWLM